MKFCNHCKKLTAGEPLFCPFCNHTYDQKLCPHRHVNSRSAQFCAECGSGDLSTPAPEHSFVVTALIHVLPRFGALVLLLLSLMLVSFVLKTIFSNQQLSGQLICVILIWALAWFVYLKVADSFAGKAVRRLLGKGGRHGGGHGSRGRGHGH